MFICRQGRSGGGQNPEYPALDMLSLGPLLEAGPNILNLHIYFFFLLINNVTICPFYDDFSNSFLNLTLNFNFFFAGFPTGRPVILHTQPAEVNHGEREAMQPVQDAYAL